MGTVYIYYTLAVQYNYVRSPVVQYEYSCTEHCSRKRSRDWRLASCVATGLVPVPRWRVPCSQRSSTIDPSIHRPSTIDHVCKAEGRCPETDGGKRNLCFSSIIYHIRIEEERQRTTDMTLKHASWSRGGISRRETRTCDVGATCTTDYSTTRSSSSEEGCCQGSPYTIMIGMGIWRRFRDNKATRTTRCIGLQQLSCYWNQN